MTPDASVALAVREKVQNFLNAALTGNIDFLKKLAKQLDDGKGLSKTVADIKDANDRTALHFAAREGRTEVCKYLLEELKLNVNVKDAEGETPLVHAARQGHIDTVSYLLEHGADPAIASDLGATALHHAAGIETWGTVNSKMQFVRCGHWWAKMLKARDQHKEATNVYFRVSVEEPLQSAVLLEQASYCYLISMSLMLRKYGFHLLLSDGY